MALRSDGKLFLILYNRPSWQTLLRAYETSRKIAIQFLSISISLFVFIAILYICGCMLASETAEWELIYASNC